MKIWGVIYIITCLLNGMKYVGQTTRTIEQRFKEHASYKTHLGYAIQKYGQENFTIEILETCETPEQLDEREIYWIAKLNCKHPNGYNLTDGGEGSKGFTEETLERMRTPKSPETVLRMTIASKKRAETPEGKNILEKNVLKHPKEKISLIKRENLVGKKKRHVRPKKEAGLDATGRMFFQSLKPNFGVGKLNIPH